MVLHQPFDPKAIQQLTEEQRIQLLQQAYGEFMQVVTTVQTHNKDILEQALKKAEAQKIEHIHAIIQSLPN